jgi:hypothetical protein
MADVGLAATDPDRLVRGTAAAWAHLLELGVQADPGNGTLREALPDLLDETPPDDTDPLEALQSAHHAITQELQDLPTDPSRPQWRELVESPVGPLPRVTYLHASAYRAAVTTLDLLDDPHAADTAAIDAGIVAFVDVLGALCARNGSKVRVAVRTERLAISLEADGAGWKLGEDTEGLPAVQAEAATLLQITSGRRQDVVPLATSGRLRLTDAKGLLPLAQVVASTEGIPGTAAIRPVLAMVQGADRLNRWLRRG